MPLRDTETLTGFSLSLEALRPTLAFAFFPPRAASSWLHTFHSSTTHTNNDPKNVPTLYMSVDLRIIYMQSAHTLMHRKMNKLPGLKHQDAPA